jgi:tRNA-dihydrouridine synthase C
MTPGTLQLAPLQGVTDPIVRELFTALGGIDACVSVFARVSNQPLPAHALLRTCPEMAHGCRTSAGVPVQLQLLGGNAALLAQTARNACEGGANSIDLNFGCPMGRVNRHDGGAALLREPERMTQILEAVRSAIPSSVPVSAKVRIGWSDAAEAVCIAQAVERGGAAWLTMHGRTRTQLYGGHADWEAIGRARAAIRIPVVANGDIRTPEDLARCAERTGCQHFMIGRGALARPELFRRLTGAESSWWPVSRRLSLLVTYGTECVSIGIPDPSVVGRVKGWWRYMAEADERVADVFRASRRLATWFDLHDALSRAVEELGHH